jgi:tetratricopeptide (TPR) repeat protein
MASTKKDQRLHDLLQSSIDAYHAGSVDAAIEHLVTAARDFPKAAKLWGYLGFLYGETGQDAKAVQAFRKAAGVSPRSEAASLGLFHSLWRVGRTDAAFNEMRRFVKSNDSPQYRRLLRDMLAESPSERTRRGELVVA